MLSHAVSRIKHLEINTYGLRYSHIVVAYMQVSLAECKRLLREIAPSGNLFLIVSLQELRLQGLSFIAFYALQRTIQAQRLFESSLRRETGLEDYEISRACKFLSGSGLIEIGRIPKRQTNPCAHADRSRNSGSQPDNVGGG